MLGAAGGQCGSVQEMGRLSVSATDDGLYNALHLCEYIHVTYSPASLDCLLTWPKHSKVKPNKS